MPERAPPRMRVLCVESREYDLSKSIAGLSFRAGRAGAVARSCVGENLCGSVLSVGPAFSAREDVY